MPMILDEAGLLTSEAEQRLAATLTQAEQTAGVEYIVRIVMAVPGRAWRQQAVADRARLSRSAERSIIVLVAVDDRHVEIATAPRFNAILDGAATGALLRESFVPRMRAGDLEGGLEATITAVGRQLASPRPMPGRRSAWPGRVVVALVLGLFAGIPTCVYVNHRICPQCRSWGSYQSRTIFPATYTSDGQGENIFDCRACGLHRVEAVVLPMKSDSSSGSDGGSDSGGGGGSDGGGGADW